MRNFIKLFWAYIKGPCKHKDMGNDKKVGCALTRPIIEDGLENRDFEYRVNVWECNLCKKHYIDEGAETRYGIVSFLKGEPK